MLSENNAMPQNIRFQLYVIIFSLKIKLVFEIISYIGFNVILYQILEWLLDYDDRYSFKWAINYSTSYKYSRYYKNYNN